MKFNIDRYDILLDRWGRKSHASNKSEKNVDVIQILVRMSSKGGASLQSM